MRTLTAWLLSQCLLSDCILMKSSNQISTHTLDLLMGTKQGTCECRPALDCCQIKFKVCTCAGYFSSENQVPFQPAAGHGRGSGMCTQRKKVPEQLKEGGEPVLLILHPSLGNNRLKPS